MSEEIENLQKVIGKLQTKSGRLTKKAEAAAKRAAKLVIKEVNEVIPIDYGDMKDSVFFFTESSGSKIEVVIGYSAPYAIYAHEDRQNTHGAAFNAKHAEEIAKHPATGPYRHPRRPQEKWKFLSVTARKIKAEIKAALMK
jgi:hypothetical protein